MGKSPYQMQEMWLHRITEVEHVSGNEKERELPVEQMQEMRE